MTHPFLEDPENDRAFAQLLAVPTGSVRTWAKSLGWSNGKMQRFLASLARYRLGEIQSCQHHSVFRPLNSGARIEQERERNPAPKQKPERVHRSVSVRTDAHRPPLGSSGLRTKKPSAAGTEYSTALITAMNEALAALFKESYRPVLLDNVSSIDTAQQLELAGVPVERAEAHLLVQCRLFNPSKHGKGDLPRSLAYFKRGIMKAWKNEAQLEIPLMQLERGEEQIPRYPEYVPPAIDLPIAKPETIDTVAQDWRAIANSPTPPRRA